MAFAGLRNKRPISFSPRRHRLGATPDADALMPQSQFERDIDKSAESPQVNQSPQPALARSLSLLHATLYGLGVTIGAGIYVLIGAAAARSGMHAPLAFLV